MNDDLENKDDIISDTIDKKKEKRKKKNLINRLIIWTILIVAIIVIISISELLKNDKVNVARYFLHTNKTIKKEYKNLKKDFSIISNGKKILQGPFEISSYYTDGLYLFEANTKVDRKNSVATVGIEALGFNGTLYLGRDGSVVNFLGENYNIPKTTSVNEIISWLGIQQKNVSNIQLSSYEEILTNSKNFIKYIGDSSNILIKSFAKEMVINDLDKEIIERKDFFEEGTITDEYIESFLEMQKVLFVNTISENIKINIDEVDVSYFSVPEEKIKEILKGYLSKKNTLYEIKNIFDLDDIENIIEEVKDEIELSKIYIRGSVISYNKDNFGVNVEMLIVTQYDEPTYVNTTLILSETEDKNTREIVIIPNFYNEYLGDIYDIAFKFKNNKDNNISLYITTMLTGEELFLPYDYNMHDGVKVDFYKNRTIDNIIITNVEEQEEIMLKGGIFEKDKEIVFSYKGEGEYYDEFGEVGISMKKLNSRIIVPKSDKNLFDFNLFNLFSLFMFQ